MQIKSSYLILAILVVALFFRTYQLVERFEFAHDADLYSWIVKDIVVDKHARLVGQLTSTEGVYIGPLFYYLLVPFYLLTGMDPWGAVILTTVLGLLTVVSFYYVFKKLFSFEVGLMAAFLQAILPIRVVFDRWVVPTNPVNLWSIWYFFAVMMILRGNFSVFFLLGILVGLIWHIHIALAPLLILVPVAIYSSKKLPPIKSVIQGLVGLIIPSIPLIIFELRHNFLQTRGFINSFLVDPGGGEGFYKFSKVIHQALGYNLWPAILLLLVALVLTWKKILKRRELIIFYLWIASMIAFFTVSTKLISEYYFTNVQTILMAIGILFLILILKTIENGKYIVALVLILVSIHSLNNLFVGHGETDNGYLQKKATAAYIASDARSKNYPCVAVSYITHPGEGVGFRYFFWLNNLHVNQSMSQSPNYTIVIPHALSYESVKARFGIIGVIPPQSSASASQIEYSCSGLNSNLTDPMLGFTK